MRNTFLYTGVMLLFYSFATAQSIRKNYHEMGPQEIQDYNDAMQLFWNSGAYNSTLTFPTNTSTIADFAIAHYENGNTGMGTVTGIHMGIYFLPFHRVFTFDWEKRLQAQTALSSLGHDYKYLSVPYWNWEDEFDALNWTDIDASTHPNWWAFGLLPVSYFDGTGSNPLWTFTYTSPFLGASSTATFSRSVVFDPPSSLPPPATVPNIMMATNYYDWSCSTSNGFTQMLEMGPHNGIHTWVGAGAASLGPPPPPPGIMMTFYSPLDPVFWLHHAMVDKLWTDWEDMSTTSIASSDLISVPGNIATPPCSTTPIFFPSTIPVYTSESCYDKVDYRTMTYNSIPEDVWYAEDGKVLINGNKSTSFNIHFYPTAKYYRYHSFNGSTYNGEIYVGDCQRSSGSVIADTKGGVDIIIDCHFRAGKEITFMPDFHAAPATSNIVTAKITSNPWDY